MTYRIVILLHILGVIVFFGTFVTAWLAYARARRRAPSPDLFALVNLGDRWLTPVSVVTIVVSGLLAADMRGLSVLGTGWIIWSLMALGVSGVVFAARLVGLQRKLAAEVTRDQGSEPASYRQTLAAWARWACIGTAAVLAALVLMVLQPKLPGF